MNLFTLILKQMRQRMLSSWLTILSVALGVALATAVLVAHRHSADLFLQTNYGYNVLIGVRGSKLNLVLNTVYGMDNSQGVIPYSTYEDLRKNGRQYGLLSAVPFMVGDAYKGHRIMAVGGGMFGIDDDTLERLPENRSFRYDRANAFSFAQGAAFHPRKFQAVVGAETAAKENIKLGDPIWLEHGGAATDVHDERWTVVGILTKTGTAMDRTIFIPLLTGYAVPEHEDALRQQAQIGEPVVTNGPSTPVVPPTPATTQDDHDHDGDGKPDHAPGDHPVAATAPATRDIRDLHDDHDDHDHDGDGKPDHAAHDHPAPATASAGHDDHDHDHHDHEKAYDLDPVTKEISIRLPKQDWRINGIFVRTVSQGNQAAKLHYDTNFDARSTAMAVYPAYEMSQFFSTFLRPATLVLLGVTVLSSVIAALSILVSIYNSILSRRREIAIVRALGATRMRVLTLICLEAALIGLVGTVIGMAVGHGIAVLATSALQKEFGSTGAAFAIDMAEIYYGLAVIVLATLAGLVPALKAYRTSVADNLVAE